MIKLSEILSVPVQREELLETIRSRMKPQINAFSKKLEFAKSNFPDWQKGILQRADEAMHGMFRLPGTKDALFFVGDPPKWHVNAVHDDEFVWGLNRTFHFETLSLAYRLTDDEKYGQRAIYELLDWIKSCPMPPIVKEYRAARESFDTVTPWRSLDAGIRAFSSWRSLFENLIDTDLFTPEVMEAFTVSMYEHALMLNEVTPIFWPKADHNHYIHEMLGLLAIACMLPELKQADEWKRMAIHELERCVNAQITEDGGQVEGCPGYHDVCLRMLHDGVYLAKQYGLNFTDGFYQKLKKAEEYSACTIKPDGTHAAWGDTDWIPGSIPKIIAMHFGLFGQLGVFEKLIPVLDEAYIKKSLFAYALTFGDSTKFEEKMREVTPDYSPCINHQRKLNQVFYHSGYNRDASFLLFTCCSPVTNGHAHIDPMTFEFSAQGKSIVIDPGRYNYKDNEKRVMVKSPEYHSTLTIGNKPPFEYKGSWWFSPQKAGYITNVYQQQGLFGADAVHFNYEPAVHRRLVALVEDKVLIVLDDVYNPERDDVRIYFHMNELNLTDDSSLRRVSDQNEGIAVCYDSKVTAQILDGVYAPRPDVFMPSKRVMLVDDHVDSDRLVYMTAISADNGVKGMTSSVHDESIEFSFEHNDVPYAFEWKSGKSLSRIQ